MENKLNIDFNDKSYVFIHTPTEEEHQDLFQKLKDAGLEAFNDDASRPSNKVETVLYIYRDTNSIKVGNYHITGYNRGYSGYQLFTYQEFVSKYFINLDNIMIDLDERIKKMEERQHEI